MAIRQFAELVSNDRLHDVRVQSRPWMCVLHTKPDVSSGYRLQSGPSPSPGATCKSTYL